jgi:hypothetical protein
MPFNDKVFHFEKSLTKLNTKIRWNIFLIWIFWHSYVLKKNDVLWLPWFQMIKNNKIFNFYDKI